MISPIATHSELVALVELLIVSGGPVVRTLSNLVGHCGVFDFYSIRIFMLLLEETMLLTLQMRYDLIQCFLPGMMIVEPALCIYRSKLFTMSLLAYLVAPEHFEHIQTDIIRLLLTTDDHMHGTVSFWYSYRAATLSRNPIIMYFGSQLVRNFRYFYDGRRFCIELGNALRKDNEMIDQNFMYCGTPLSALSYAVLKNNFDMVKRSVGPKSF